MDNQLKQKLSAFEAKPPDALWQRIAASVDEVQPSFAIKLQEHSEAPADTVWKRIENELDESLPAKLIPFRTRYKVPIRYASAAAIIGVVLITSTLVMKRTEAGSLGTAEQSVVGSVLPSNSSATLSTEAAAPTATTEWVVYKDAHGDTMRMQQKLFDLLQCKNGDDACRRRVAELRKKLSSANATSDFTGLLEMVRQIK